MIRLLSKETIDKIAAGEVVERPENVVRELLDNAMDSGASSISCEIRGGGTELIRVTDNGCGIAAEDLPNAFTRHATSKLVTAEDLQHIRTMGFRGEALASIAGVSRVELITKRPEDLTGSRYVIEGGVERSIQDIGVPSGTTLIVRDLFFNVPVRRQFLKQPKTEGSYVRDIVEKAALSSPHISFSFLQDGRQLFHTTGSGKLKDVIYTIYGIDITENLLTAGYESLCGRITGFISNPALSRTRRDTELYFVNSRFVRSSVIDRAIETAYEGYLMQHRFPFTVLNLQIQPESVDVNIHPQKTEVRFSDDEAVFDLVYTAVRETLSHREHIREALKKETPAKPEKEVHIEPFEKKKTDPSENILSGIADKAPGIALLKEAADRFRTESGLQKNPDSLSGTAQNSQVHANGYADGKRENTEENTDNTDNTDKTENQGTAVPGLSLNEEAHAEQLHLKFLDPESRKHYKFIGQVFNTYWLIEYEGALYIIDQHAAHEKVNYEKLTQKIRNNEVTSQEILPVLVTLNAKDAVLLEDHLDDFAKAGYEIESAGDRDFYIRSVPACLPELSEKQMFISMLESLSSGVGEMKNTPLTEKIASMSCKAAVKGNRPLSEPEMRALTDELLNCRDPYNCPHGRPVMVKFSKYELDKMFKRIV